METIKKNLASLIKVKTIVTMVVISMVVSFYFGTQHEKTQTENPTA